MKIFITSWHRMDFMSQTLLRLAECSPDAHVTVYDNGSDRDEQERLVQWKQEDLIQDLFLADRNSGTMLPKRIFHALARAAGDEFYVVTDNDFLCANGWMESMLDIMRAHPEIAVLTPQYWPQWPMGPKALSADGKVVYCNAVGNTFKMVRTAAVDPWFRRMDETESQAQDFVRGVRGPQYSDDGLLCKWIASQGFERSAFCTNVFCYNLEPSAANWGYEAGQEKGDPRRAGYGAPSPQYMPKDWETLELPEELKWRP